MTSNGFFSLRPSNCFGTLEICDNFASAIFTYNRGNTLNLRSQLKPALPELTMHKERERQAIEADIKVNNLIRSNLLLDAQFNRLYLRILEESKRLLEIIELTEDQLYSQYFSVLEQSKKLKHPSKFSDAEVLRLLLHFLTSDMLKGDMVSREKLERIFGGKMKFDALMFETKELMFADARKKAIMLSDKIQKSISVFEEKKEIELDILASTTIHVCKKCAKIISLNKFKRCTCICGEKITKPSQVEQIPLKHFNEKLINFLDQNYWFEYGMDYLLRRKNLQTLVGYYVLGHSGVWHEIDNIAVSKSRNYRFFCECKNTEVKQNDIFVFSGKMVDIGCTRGYIFTTSEEVSDEIIRLARAKNIDIVKEVLKRGITDLLKDIKEA